MLEELIKKHSGDIVNMLTKNHGLSTDQAKTASTTIVDSISGFVSSQAASGKLDVNNLMDLFNKNTPNQSNPLFSGISEAITGGLEKSGISQDVISKISSGGLDDVLKIAQGGKLGAIDMNTLTTAIAAVSGKGGGLSGLVGGITNLFGKK